MVKARVAKNDGSYIFADFSTGLYLLDTPRGLGEQLASLALIDGRNVWCERGALVPQYGYSERAKFPTNKDADGNEIPVIIKGWTKADTSADNLMVLCNETDGTKLEGVVYVYSASQGLKKYKTSYADGFTNPIIARRGKDLIIYDAGITTVFGAYYGNDSVEKVAMTAQPVSFVNYTSYGELTVGIDELQYFWNGKEVLIENEPCTIMSVAVGKDDDYGIVRVAPYKGVFDFETTLSTVTPYEQTKLAVTLVYQPEDTDGTEPVTLLPQLMAVSNNRLFVEHSNGNIYYSSIGFAFTNSNHDLINPFEESGGAGYFGGFYNDTTRLLSIEDYFNGILLTKENGFYYLTIGSQQTAMQSVVDAVKIEKISQAGQQYATDHVIVGNDVFAYDYNSGSLVKAIQVSYFGNLVAGKTLVASEFLNVNNFNINTSNRCLTYNYESQILILYYGADLRHGVVYSLPEQSLFPRELDKPMLGYTGFNQGVIGITEDGRLLQDFKRGMIIPELSSYASFEPIGVRDNRMICSSILEVTELNGVNYNVSTSNAGSSFQQIQPSFYQTSNGDNLLPFIYSEDDYLADSYELTSRWAEISSNRTRLYAPMSGRNGVSISIEFESDKPFCLSMIRLPDFSQGN